jgi:hypothetical protein
LRGVDLERVSRVAQALRKDAETYVVLSPGDVAADPEVLDVVQQQDADQTTCDADKLALAAEAGDVGAPFEPAALATLRNLKAQDFAGWVRLRTRLKRAGVGVTELDRQLQHGEGAPPDDDDESVADRLIALARNRCQVPARRAARTLCRVRGRRRTSGAWRAVQWLQRLPEPRLLHPARPRADRTVAEGGAGDAARAGAVRGRRLPGLHPHRQDRSRLLA